ncbi:SMI1/KNR4 family protein [Marinifilum fragile]|uniref:SMI1/KNR4 family protein n=1 Tax=Marinifilum fragile TaxID=570161 RepID=UPI002AA7E3FB|nr:SMI1/KNR4 family protein [Marinifilum fragile]
MTELDIKLIEDKLNIKLPDFYIRTMLDYPFAYDSFGAEFSLCNSVKHVIDCNGIFEPEDKCFSIGSDGGEFYYFIKLNGEEKVYVFDLEGSKEHLTVEAETWADYLDIISKQHEEILQDELESAERKRNKKWWQFWI